MTQERERPTYFPGKCCCYVGFCCATSCSCSNCCNRLNGRCSCRAPASVGAIASQAAKKLRTQLGEET